jgi:hypothetical protein
LSVVIVSVSVPVRWIFSTPGPNNATPLKFATERVSVTISPDPGTSVGLSSLEQAATDVKAITSASRIDLLMYVLLHYDS